MKMINIKESCPYFDTAIEQLEDAREIARDLRSNMEKYFDELQDALSEIEKLTKENSKLEADLYSSELTIERLNQKLNDNGVVTWKLLLTKMARIVLRNH